jgi:hypothetical protein
MATSNSYGVVVSGALTLGVSSTDASRVSPARTRRSLPGGTPIAVSAVRSLTKNLRIAYPSVEGNIASIN